MTHRAYCVRFAWAQDGCRMLAHIRQLYWCIRDFIFPVLLPVHLVVAADEPESRCILINVELHLFNHPIPEIHEIVAGRLNEGEELLKRTHMTIAEDAISLLRMLAYSLLLLYATTPTLSRRD